MFYMYDEALNTTMQTSSLGSKLLLSYGMRHPEDGSRKFLRNIDILFPNYTPSYPRSQ
jgi:hypothetical protein